MTEETTNLEEALNPSEQPPEQKQAEPEPTPEEPKAEEPPKPAADDPNNITVPLKALHEVRDANKALKAEMEALKAERQQLPEPLEAPDPLEDPAAYADYTQKLVDRGVSSVQQQFQNRLLDLSEAQAVRNHGQDSVDSVKEWFATQPASFQQEALGQADPYDYAIQQHKRQVLTEQLTSDPDKLDRILKALEGRAPEAPKAPATTATHQSVGSRKGPEWAGPTPLDQIL